MSMRFGVEIEYGVARDVVDTGNGRLLLPLGLPRQYGELHQGAFLPNGGKLYWDCGHPEYSTPECGTARELAAHVVAGRGIVVDALLGGGNRRRREPVLFRHSYWPGRPLTAAVPEWTQDDVPTTWACHENYSWEVGDQLALETMRLDAMRAFALSREAWSGAGGLSWGQEGDGRPWTERPGLLGGSVPGKDFLRMERPRLFFSRCPRMHHVFMTGGDVAVKSLDRGARLQLKTPDIPLSSGVMESRALVTSAVVGAVREMPPHHLASVPRMGNYVPLPDFDLAMTWQEAFARAIEARGHGDAGQALLEAIAAARDGSFLCDWAAKRGILAEAGLLEPHGGGGWVVPRGLEAEALEADARLGAVHRNGRSPWDEVEQDPVVTAEEVSAAARFPPRDERAQARARLVRDLGFSSDDPCWREDGLWVQAGWGLWNVMFRLFDRAGNEASREYVFDVEDATAAEGVRIAREKFLADFPSVAENPSAWFATVHGHRKGRPAAAEVAPAAEPGGAR